MVEITWKIIDSKTAVYQVKAWHFDGLIKRRAATNVRPVVNELQWHTKWLTKSTIMMCPFLLHNVMPTAIQCTGEETTDTNVSQRKEENLRQCERKNDYFYHHKITELCWPDVDSGRVTFILAEEHKGLF